MKSQLLKEAAGVTPRTKTPKKTVSLSEQLERYKEMDPSMIDDMMQEIAEMAAESESFRGDDLATQLTQDRVLEEYRKFIRIKEDQPADLADDEIDKLAFCTDQERLISNMKQFIIWAYNRSNDLSTEVSYSDQPASMDYASLIAYRDALLFWTLRCFKKRGRNVPSEATLHENITDSVNWVQKDFGIRNRKVIHASIGLPELRQLLDYEMSASKNIEVSEQHQVLWCFFRQTAARTDLLRWNTQREENLLRWKDIKFVNRGQGKWLTIITLDHLQTSFYDPQELRIQGRDVHMDSPNADNIIFSVPHRLLVIAIRRGILRSVKTIDEVLSTNLAFLLIKEEHLQQPVFFPGKTCGGIDTEADDNGQHHAMSASEMTAYIADCGQALGYCRPISIDSIGRRTAIDLIARMGMDGARQVMGYPPESFQLKRHYPAIRSEIKMVDVLVNQPNESRALSTSRLKELAPMRLGAIPQDMVESLDNLVESLIAEDSEYPADGDALIMEIYCERVRSHALCALLDEAATRHDTQITTQEMRAGGGKLLNYTSSFAKAVREKAKVLMQNKVVDVNITRQGENTDYNLNDSFRGGNGQAPGLEQTTSAVDDPHLVSAAEEFDAANRSSSEMGADPSIPYVMLARAFMEILESNSMNE